MSRAHRYLGARKRSGDPREALGRPAGATERDALGRPFQAHWTARMREEYNEQMAEREPRRREGEALSKRVER